jgi:hypothetical protein
LKAEKRIGKRKGWQGEVEIQCIKTFNASRHPNKSNEWGEISQSGVGTP